MCAKIGAMTSSTTYKILAPVSAAALLVTGLALTDHLPGPASAAEEAAPVAHTPRAALSPADLVAGLALTGRLPGPAAAAEEPAHAAHTPGEALSPAEGVEHRTAASDAAQERAVLDYWTPRRMADATPIAGLVGDTVEEA